MNMLDYLVTSRTRRTLLKLLWCDGENGTAADLAEKAGVAFAGAYKELKAMSDSELAKVEWCNGRKEYSANTSHPMAHLLLDLLKEQEPKQKNSYEPSSKLKENLAYLGMPVNARKSPPKKGTRVESLLVDAANLAKDDASVARALPVLFHKLKNVVDYDVLKFESRKKDNKHRVGFFLDLEGVLSKDRDMSEVAQEFFDKRYKSDKLFFSKQSKYAKELALARTPELAKKWGWLMNMSMDTFESHYRKFQNV